MAAADPGLEIDASPNVHLHGVTFLGSPPPVALLVHDSNLQVEGSSVAGSRGVLTFAVGGAAVQADNSRLVLAASSAVGGRGLDDAGFGPGKGGDGIRLLNGATLIALDTVISGGQGGLGTINPGGNGGDGIVASGGSFARSEGAAPLGGLAGSSFLAGSGVNGAPWAVGPGSTVLVNATSIPALGSLVGPQTIGSTVTFTVTAAPGSVAYLGLGDPAHFAIGLQFIGSLLTTAVSAFPFGFVPVSGTLGLPVRLSASMPLDVPLYAQFAAVELGGTAWLSNSFFLLVKS